MDLVEQSFIEVMNQTISQTPIRTTHPLKRGYAASIGMKGRVEKEVIILYNKAFLHLCCQQYLGDDAPSDETCIDIAKEYANLTIGHAKLLAKEEQTHFLITTPKYLGIVLIRDIDEARHFCIGTARCSLYMKR